MPKSLAELALWRDEALKSLPLISIICFAVAVLMLFYIFDGWGFSAVQMVAPSDVLMVGIVLGVMFLFLIAIPVTAALLFDLSRLGPISRRRVSWTAVALLLSAPLWSLWSLLDDLAAVGVLILAAGAALHVLFNKGWQKVLAPRLRAPAAVVMVAPLVTWLSLAIQGVLAFIDTQGFAKSATVEDKVLAPCVGQLLWLGEKSVIVRCANADLGILAMTPQGGLAIQPAEESRRKPDGE